MKLSRHQNRKSCISANSTHRKSRLKRQYTQFNQSNFQQAKNSQSQNNHMALSHKFNHPPKSCVDPYREHLKFLIAQNADYFKSKLKISDKVGPNKYRFKIPTKTPVTIYRKHFEQKHPNLSVDNLKVNRNDFSIDKIISKQNDTINFQNKKQPTNNMVLKSTYQNSFAKILKTSKNKHRKDLSSSTSSLNGWIDGDAPRFLQTQNNHFYLNWGPNNAISSMKPSYSTVTNMMPFDGRTVYKNDFQGKIVPKSKMVIPQCSISRTQSSMMINKSYYAAQFGNKQNILKQLENKQNILKEEAFNKSKKFSIKPTINFKGSTEYRSEFRKDISKFDQQNQSITKENLCTLILDL